jgi:sodium/hydrogen antiporter
VRAEFWFILVGFLLAGIAATGALIKRLPMTTAMVYFAVGIVMGSHVLGPISLDPIRDAGLLERFAEIALVISLFTTGLKLRLPLRDSKWRLAWRLAFVSMTITIVLAAVLGVYLLALPTSIVVHGFTATPLMARYHDIVLSEAGR